MVPPTLTISNGFLASGGPRFTTSLFHFFLDAHAATRSPWPLVHGLTDERVTQKPRWNPRRGPEGAESADVGKNPPSTSKSLGSGLSE